MINSVAKSSGFLSSIGTKVVRISKVGVMMRRRYHKKSAFLEMPINKQCEQESSNASN
jgi:hypothetical protein